MHADYLPFKVPPLTGEFVTDCGNVAGALREAAGDLRRRGSALTLLFQPEFGLELLRVACVLESASDAISKLCGRSVSDSLRAAQESTGQIFKLAIAGMLQPPPDALRETAEALFCTTKPTDEDVPQIPTH